MEEAPKKGPRDISDLKARLGLKTGGARVPAPLPGIGSGASAGPNATAGRPVPAPPGFEPPRPAAPDPRRDPFAAAASAPAAAPYYAYAPLPGVDDGKPAEKLHRPKLTAKAAVYGGIALGALIFGYSWGFISFGRQNYNRTIDEAGGLRVEVEKLGKTLGVITDRLNSSPDAAKGNPDLKLAADLGSMDLKDPESQKLFHTNYYFLEDLAIARLFSYYDDTLKLYKLIRDHAKKTDGDREAIENFLKNGAQKGDRNFGVVMDMSGAIPLAHFVEVGAPVCPKEGQTDCNASELKGFKYRVDTGAGWSQKPVKGKPGETVVPIQKTPLFATVVAGNPDVLAVKDHLRRMAEIRLITLKLFNEQRELLASLKTAAERKKSFILF